MNERPALDLTDAQLLRSADEDGVAFGAFYRRNEQRVLAFFMRRLRDPYAAADLTADTFAAALAGRHRYRPRSGSPEMWLYGIARRKLADFLRRGRADHELATRLGIERCRLTTERREALEALQHIEPESPLWSALEELPANQRVAVRWRVLHDASYASIAARQRTTEPAVRQSVSRGLARLRAILGATS